MIGKAPLVTLMGEIVFVNLASMSLLGTLPQDMKMLTKLTELRRQRNNFLSCSIPKQFGALSDMAKLFIFHTQMRSSIPTEIGLLTNLQVLEVGANMLSGPIPSEIGQLTLLESLVVGENTLSGTVPPELGKLPLLRDTLLEDDLLTREHFFLVG